MVSVAVFRTPKILATHVNETSFRVSVDEVRDRFYGRCIRRNRIAPVKNVFDIMTHTIVFECPSIGACTIIPRFIVRTNTTFDDGNRSRKTIFNILFYFCFYFCLVCVHTPKLVQTVCQILKFNKFKYLQNIGVKGFMKTLHS